VSSAKKFFADTTVVYYVLHGHSLQKEAVRDAVRDGMIAVSNFVKGEYIRGYVIGLIDLYSAIKEEQSVEDGIHLFLADMGHHPRKVANALQSTTTWLCGFEDWPVVDKTLRRLGEYIRGCLSRFDLHFLTRSRDQLNCEIGILSFPQETYDETHLFNFYREFEQVTDGPTCSQCDFRQDQQTRLIAAGIDLYSPAQQVAHAKHEGYVKQAKNIDKAVRSKMTSPSCWYCDRLGDTIIALAAPDEAVILTGDAASFPALAAILGKTPPELIPSLQKLRERRP
jgi:hypothetical protein